MRIEIRMNRSAVCDCISNLLVSNDGFSEKNDSLVKDISINNNVERLFLRIKDDNLTLINISRNEKILEQSLNVLDENDFQRVVKEAYQRIKEKLNHLEGEPISNVDVCLETTEQKENLFKDVTVFTPFDGTKAGLYVFTDQAIVHLSTKARVNHTIESTPQINEKQITREVRKFLKMELKIGADFSRTKNGINVARGDYIVLTESYQQKVGFFSQLNLPKGAELHVTGSKPKNGKTYAVCAIDGRSYAIDVQYLKADYGQQYVRRYYRYPDLKKKVDSVILEENKDKGVTMDSIQKMMQKHQVTAPKSDQKLKYTM